jgi:hypothetical protein
VEEHKRHVQLILNALRKASLYCNPDKCKFFQLEIDFLGHRISANGIEPQSSKVNRVLDWPVPKSAKDVRSFLGLVRYIAAFLPKLAEHTILLTPLTTTEAKRHFPGWTPQHQHAFDAIKSLVVSRECLTVIDHQAPGDNKIFVTCDASDWRTGATLSFGPTWETARPVAFDSMQLKPAEKNYPVHESFLRQAVAHHQGAGIWTAAHLCRRTQTGGSAGPLRRPAPPTATSGIFSSLGEGNIGGALVAISEGIRRLGRSGPLSSTDFQRRTVVGASDQYDIWGTTGTQGLQPLGTDGQWRVCKCGLWKSRFSNRNCLLRTAKL